MTNEKFVDLTNIQTVKSLLRQYGLRPRKHLGQHFLVDREVLEEILAAAEISPEDLILEIGAGLGVLTMEMAKRAKKIIAVEKDPALCRILQEILKTERIHNVAIVNQDILKISNFQFLISKQKSKNTKYQIQNTKYKIVANLPYYLTARIIRKFLETDNPPNEMVLMIQKEVAERICASPPKMSFLAVSVQFYARPEIIAVVSKKSFWPEPEVASMVIKISDIRPGLAENSTKIFFRIVRAGFSSPRKKMANNLVKILPELTRRGIADSLQKIGLRPDCRSQDLSVDNWRELVSLLGKNIV